MEPASNSLESPKKSLRRCERLSYQEFEENAAYANQPIIIGSAMTSAWPCIEEWRQRTESGSSDIPNLSALRNFAHHLVQVADCSTRRYNEFDREERHLGQILDLWEKEGESGSTLYVKDWHQALLLEEDGGKQDQVYTTPDVFQDDWMTHHALTLDPPDDYRFTYAGPKGTYTPLHRDVYGSYSWSSNIVGRKRWWLIPPEHTDIVWTQPGGSEVVFDLRELDETLWRERVLEVVQEAGETIFVPSGWYHQVENLDFCISINQNFASSHIMPTIYRNLLESQARVEEAISDVKALLRDHATKSIDSSETVEFDVQPWELEWLNQVQSLLEMDAGWGLRGFWGMVLHNLRKPPTGPSLRPSDEYIHSKIRPLVHDFRKRREYTVLQDLRSTVDEVSSIVDVYTDS